MTDQTRARLRRDLIRDEGLKLHAYQDHLGFWTIGVGRLIDKRKGGGIAEDEAHFLLDNDIDHCLDDLKTRYPWVIGLDEARQRALCNMRFQLGAVGLAKFKATLAELERHDYEAAADHMLHSLWARQTPQRAQRIAHLVRRGWDA